MKQKPLSIDIHRRGQHDVHSGGAADCEQHATQAMLVHEEARRLYLLSYLLTGDEVKAKQCFVPGLDEAASDHGVFRSWAHAWARRMIVRRAMRILRMRPALRVEACELTYLDKLFRRLRRLCSLAACV